MSELATVSQIDFLTLAEIRLLKQLYRDLSEDELAILFRKPKDLISGMAKELGLKKKEVHHA